MPSPDLLRDTFPSRAGTSTPDGERPDWYADAACLGDGPGRWTLATGCSPRLDELRQVCALCPVSGHCLRDALSMPKTLRDLGPVRVGSTGHKSWTANSRLVESCAPVSHDDWQRVATTILNDL